MESLQKYVIDHHQKQLSWMFKWRIVLLAKLHEASKAQKKLNTEESLLHLSWVPDRQTLFNNLINLGSYDDVKKELSDAEKTWSKSKKWELEPPLGNGGLGRLAACFIDSISSLGLTGGWGWFELPLGLFQQVLKNNQQENDSNAWLTDQSWPVSAGLHSYQVPFAHFTLTPYPLWYRCPCHKIGNQEPLAFVRLPISWFIYYWRWY